MLKAVKRQDPAYDDEIQFKKVKNGRSEKENQQRWQRMKKLVTRRCGGEIGEVLKDLEIFLKKQKDENLDDELEGDDLDKEKNYSVEMLSLFRES